MAANAFGNVSFQNALSVTYSLKLVNLDKGPQFLESHLHSGHIHAADLLMKSLYFRAPSVKH